MSVEVDTVRTAITPVVGVGGVVDLLHETADQYYWCQQETVEYCWNEPKTPADLKTVKRDVRNDIYARLKEETDLHANLVQAAIKQVVENVKSLKTDWQKGRRVSKPDPTVDDGWLLDFDKRSATFHKHGIELSLADNESKHFVEFELPNKLDGTPYSEYVLSDLFEYSMTRVEYRPHSEHKFYAHIVNTAEFETPAITDVSDSVVDGVVSGELSVRSGWREAGRELGFDAHEHRRVLGVDLNVTGYSAVTSAGGFHGSADELNHRRNEFEEVRAGLQQTGTRSAHLTMKSRKGREWAWFDQRAHEIANGICRDAIRTRSTDVALERLTDIRERISDDKEYQQWFFKRIQKYVEYKLEPYGIAVDDVCANHTSQACSRTDCDCVSRSNRDGKSFECERCGYALDADLNAAKNIAYRYVREEIRGESLADGEKWFDELCSSGVSVGHKSQPGRADCQLALKSGTITLDGNFTREAWSTPTDQFTDKPLPQQSESAATSD